MPDHPDIIPSLSDIASEVCAIDTSRSVQMHPGEMILNAIVADLGKHLETLRDTPGGREQVRTWTINNRNRFAQQANDEWKDTRP